MNGWRYPRVATLRLVLVTGLVGLAALLASAPAAAQRASAGVPKPHPVRGTVDTNPFSQAVVRAVEPPTAVINGLDVKVAHVNHWTSPVAEIRTPLAPPNGAASYSFAGGAYTKAANGVRYWLQMGYLVLSGEHGLARWFIQVLQCSTTTAQCTPHTWTISRAGDNVRLGAAYRELDPGELYVIGELTVTGPATALQANRLGPRTTLRSLALWTNGASGWREAAGGEVQYYPAETGCVPPYGVELADADPDSAKTLWTETSGVGGVWHALRVGGDGTAGADPTRNAACTPAGTRLW